MQNILKEEIKVLTNSGSPLPQKTLFLKRHINNFNFLICDFVTSHYVSMSHICIIYARGLVFHVGIHLAHLLCC